MNCFRQYVEEVLAEIKAKDLDPRKYLLKDVYDLWEFDVPVNYVVKLFGETED